MAEKNNRLAVKRSWIRVLLLGILSFGLYYLYWFYVTRKQVDAELGAQRTLKQSPAWQLFGPILLMIVSVPLMLIIIGIFGYIAAAILAIYVFYALIKDMSTVAQRAGTPEISVPLVVVLQLFTGLGILVAQDGWNKFLDKKTNGKATDAPYTAGEIAVSVAGLVVVGGIIVLALVLGAIFSDNTNDLEKQLKEFESQSQQYNY